MFTLQKVFSKELSNKNAILRNFSLLKRENLPFYCRFCPNKLNYEINANTIRLIYPEHLKKEPIVCELKNGLNEAEKLNLDLVLINNKIDPPICKLLVYKEFAENLYDDTIKRDKMQRKLSSLKEIKIKAKIGEHDIDTKVFNLIFKQINKIYQLLYDKLPVRVTIIGKLKCKKNEYEQYKLYRSLKDNPSSHSQKIVANIKSKGLTEEKIKTLEKDFEEIHNYNIKLFDKIDKAVVNVGRFQGDKRVTDLSMTAILIPKTYKPDEAEIVIKEAIEEIDNNEQVEINEPKEKRRKNGEIKEKENIKEKEKDDLL